MKILFILSLVISLYGSSFNLDYSKEKFEDFSLEYLNDKNSTYSVEQVRTMKFKNISNEHAFSGKTGNTWYKLKFHNSTVLDKTIYLHQSLAFYFKFIYIYEYNASKLLNQEKYDILKSNDSNRLIGSSLIHELVIPAKQDVEVYIKTSPMISNIFYLNIYSKENNLQALIEQHFYSIIIIVTMFTLAMYNFVLFFFIKRKEFLLYSFYLFIPTLGLTYKYGIIFSHFHLYGENTYWLNLTAIVMPAFLILFVKQVLNTNAMDKKIDYILNAVLTLISIDVFLAFTVGLTYAIETFKIIFMITTFSLIYTIVYMYKNNHPLRTLFTFAYSAYLAGLICTILAMSGIIELNFFTFHSGGIGIIVEGLLFSYLMHYNVRLLENKIAEQKKLIISTNKKAQLGEMISAITHQWKQPLQRIASTISLLEFKVTKKQNIPKETIQKTITQINDDILFLNETIDDFKDFFNDRENKQICAIDEIINKAIELSKDDTFSKEILIKTDLHFDSKLDVYKNELLHILLNILQNSKEAFQNSKSKIKIIKVIGYTKNEHAYIDIIDNAGGINKETLPFIFDEHYTTKESKSGTGIGLYLAKIILKNHFNGSIEAFNIKEGAMFRIIL